MQAFVALKKKKALHTGRFNFSMRTELQHWLRPRLGTMF